MELPTLRLDIRCVAWMGRSSSAKPEVVGPLLALTFEALYRNDHARLVRRVYLIVGSMALAEDIVHETFVEVLRRWATLDSPAAYLQRAVLSNAASGAKRAAREVALVPTLVDIGEGLAFDDVRDALGVLPFRQRAAIVLR
jgi:DNA-directed RNA polymerase specialized sigma24 family protein